MLYFFLGKAFGVLRLHGGYPFMFGQWHGGEILTCENLIKRVYDYELVLFVSV